MALGQGVGRAIETTALENMRQQNLQMNWARQDKIRAEDAARADEIRLEQNERQDNRWAEEDSRFDRSLEAQTDRDKSTAEYRDQMLGFQQEQKQMAAFQNMLTQEYQNKRLELDEKLYKAKSKAASGSGQGAKEMLDLFKQTTDFYDKTIQDLIVKRTDALDEEDRASIDAAINSLKSERASKVLHHFGGYGNKNPLLNQLGAAEANYVYQQLEESRRLLEGEVPPNPEDGGSQESDFELPTVSGLLSERQETAKGKDYSMAVQRRLVKELDEKGLTGIERSEAMFEIRQSGLSAKDMTELAKYYDGQGNSAKAQQVLSARMRIYGR
jgi:hypothetical protein